MLSGLCPNFVMVCSIFCFSVLHVVVLHSEESFFYEYIWIHFSFIWSCASSRYNFRRSRKDYPLEVKLAYLINSAQFLLQFANFTPWNHFFHEYIYICFLLFSLQSLASRILGGLEHTWSTACTFHWLCPIFITVCFAFYFLAFHFYLIIHDWNSSFFSRISSCSLVVYLPLLIWLHSTRASSIKWLFMENQLKLKLALFGNKQRVSDWCSNKKGLIFFNSSDFYWKIW